jgi:hypothetical protein
MGNKYDIVIIDVFNLYHRNYHKKKVNYKEECLKLFQETVEGFFISLKKTMYKFGKQFTKYYFCFDNPHTYENLRKSLYEDYKKDRKNMSSNFYKWLKIIELLLKNFNNNFYTVKIDFLEADDYIIDIIEKHKNKKTLLYSQDLDWSRSIDNNIVWYDGTYEYDINKYKEEFGFDPRNKKVVLYKALRGDISDNIPNILKHLDNKILVRLVNEFDNVEDLFLKYETLDYLSDHYKNIIKNNKKEIQINYQVVDYISISSYNERIENYIKECKRNVNLLAHYCNTFKVDVFKIFNDHDKKDSFKEFSIKKNKKLRKGRLF